MANTNSQENPVGGTRGNITPGRHERVQFYLRPKAGRDTEIVIDRDRSEATSELDGQHHMYPRLLLADYPPDIPAIPVHDNAAHEVAPFTRDGGERFGSLRHQRMATAETRAVAQLPQEATETGKSSSPFGATARKNDTSNPWLCSKNRMAQMLNRPVKEATKTVEALGCLALLGLGVSLGFVAILLLGNVALCLLAHVADTLLDLINAIFTG